MNQNQGKPSHVFIVNPQELVRVGIRTLLESVTDFTVIGEASSATGRITAHSSTQTRHRDARLAGAGRQRH